MGNKSSSKEFQTVVPDGGNITISRNNSPRLSLWNKNSKTSAVQPLLTPSSTARTQETFVGDIPLSLADDGDLDSESDQYSVSESCASRPTNVDSDHDRSPAIAQHGVDTRGFKLELFQSIRDIAISRNNDPSFWTIENIRSLLYGNRASEGANAVGSPLIVGQSSLMSLLRTSYYNSSHPMLNLNFTDVASDGLAHFVSFSYSDNYFDLIKALEEFQNTKPIGYWFELFAVNPYHCAQDYRWWSETYPSVIKDTLCTIVAVSPCLRSSSSSCFASPKVLYDIFCSTSLRILISQSWTRSIKGKLSESIQSFRPAIGSMSLRFSGAFDEAELQAIIRVAENRLGGVEKFDKTVSVKVLSCLKESQAFHCDGDSTVIDLTYGGLVTTYFGLFKQANALFQRAFCDLESKLGFNSMDTLEVAMNYCSFVVSIGDCETAKPLAQRIFASCQQSASKLSLRNCFVMERLGEVYVHLFDEDTALILTELALGRLENLLGNAHRRVMLVKAKLAKLIQSQQPKRAIELLESVLQPCDSCNIVSNVDLLTVANDLAVLLKSGDSRSRAMELFAVCLAGRERHLGKSHLDTLKTLENFAELHTSMGNALKSQAMLERALASLELIYGLGNARTLACIDHLANIYKDQSDWGRASAMYCRALRIREVEFGVDHINTLITVNNLANMLKAEGQWKDSKLMYQRAMNGFQQALGANHPNVLSTMNNLASVHQIQGELEEAKRLYGQALVGIEKMSGSHHPSALIIISNLAALFEAQNNLVEAKVMYQRALDGLEVAVGLEHMETVRTMLNLADLLKKLGDLTAAKLLFERVLKTREKILGVTHLETLRVLKKFVEILEAEGDMASASKFKERLSKSIRESKAKKLQAPHIMKSA